jgi:hypothetical protein
MCDEIGVLTDKEVKGLDAKARKRLRAEALRHLRSPAIQNLIKKKDPIARIVHPHGYVRAKLRKQLIPKLNALKKASSAK